MNDQGNSGKGGARKVKLGPFAAALHDKYDGASFGIASDEFIVRDGLLSNRLFD